MNSEQQPIETVIVGLGTTGLSVARYLSKQQQAYAVVDSRTNPPGADALLALNPAPVTHVFGGFSAELLNHAKELIVSPGVPVETPEVSAAKNAGAALVGDIELFYRNKNSATPTLAITGSNGKTTVTTLLDLMAKEAQVNVATGGNIGMAALDLLDNTDAQLFVLELSSYQLETTPSIQNTAAVILNLSEDHLDRYNNDIEQYAEAKAHIYANCEHIVYNREDAYSTRFATQLKPQPELQKSCVSFGLDAPQGNDYGLRLDENGEEWLAKGEQLLMRVTEVKQVGRHNLANALAALALGEKAGLDNAPMLKVLREFKGMEHRTQWVAEINGVNFYNDSKGTNTGATLSALSGLSGKTVLIAGGQGKGADFFTLSDVIKAKARAVVLMGEDAARIAEAVDADIPHVFVNSMAEAVTAAFELAEPTAQDNVLLSPACASFDMFDSYIQRGLHFIDAVEELKTQQEVSHV